MAEFLGATGVETSGGKPSSWPTPEQQMAIGKYYDDRREFGPAKMNKAMLRDLGYSDAYMEEMNQNTPDGWNKAAAAYAKGVQTYNTPDRPDGFYVFNRDGIGEKGKSGYSLYKETGQMTQDQKDFRENYQQTGQLALKDGMANPNSN